MARFNWKEIELPVLKNILSTEDNITISRNQWPEWARDNHKFTGAWFSFRGGKIAESTEHLSTDEIRAQVDIERTDEHAPRLRYYRFFMLKLEMDAHSKLALLRTWSSAVVVMKDRSG